MWKTLFSILFSLVFVSGCIKIPTDEARCMLEPTPSLEHTTHTAQESNTFMEGEFPQRNWWEMFDDAQLSHLICMGLQDNPSLKKVEARIRSAEAAAKVKRSHLFPTVGFNVDADWIYFGKNDFFRAFTPVIPANVAEYEIDIEFYYQFDFWGKNRNFYRAALGIVKAQAAERDHAVLALSASIASVYFKLQANLKKLQILEKERAVFTRLFQLTEERTKNALDNSMQKLSSEEQLFAINKNILITKQLIQLNQHLLNNLLGEGPDCYQEVHKISTASNFAFPLPSHLSCDLLARRPDLMALIWRVEAAAHLVGAAKADFYPNIDLSALGGFDSVFFNKWFTRGSLAGRIKPALHLPIFTAGRIKANLRKHKAEFEEAIYAYNESLLESVKEVADQITKLQTADETLNVQNSIVQNKVANRNLINQRYEHALDNMLDLLQAEDVVLKEQFLKIKSEYKKIIAAIRLVKALGGGYCYEEIPLE